MKWKGGRRGRKEGRKEGGRREEIDVVATYT